MPERTQVTNDSGPDTTNIPADGGLGSSSRLRARKLLLQRAAKRAFDITLATIGILLFSPLFLLSSLAIVLDTRGPILCRQVRHGCGTGTFRIFTFRCTTTENGNVDTARSGACLTRIGRILRSSGIEGLPQLLNVLRGDMSIVGPGPYTAFPGVIFEQQILRISQERYVKPGLTGPAQVNGYGDVSNSFEAMKRRIEYDLHYVENWSFYFDMKIIMKTLCAKSTYARTDWTSDR
jgi:lipopolysaccharide/colanic/teichoic acid biosynthesis glycosyltransferase